MYILKLCYIINSHVRKYSLMTDGYKEYKMKKEEKKEYQKPELVEHESLNEITQGGPSGGEPDGEPDSIG